MAGCSEATLSLFFDIPPKSKEEAAPAVRQAPQPSSAAIPAPASPVEEGERPEIESVLDWEAVQEMLPKDDIDEVDWMAALRQAVIKPRAAISGPADAEARVFRLDFFIPGPDPSLDAYFPHSSHTEWLTCASCHPAIFRYRDNEVTMDAIFEGEYCAKCHGLVAFALDSCNRCHLNM